MTNTLKVIEIVKLADRTASDLAVLGQFCTALADAIRSGRGITLEQAHLLHKSMQLINDDITFVEVKEQGPEPRPEAPKALSMELHLGPSSDFVRTHGKRVKAAGGNYRAARGYADKRFVFLPNTVEGRALANELVRLYPGNRGHYHTVVIFDIGRSARRVVETVRSVDMDTIENALERCDKDIAKSIDKGWL